MCEFRKPPPIRCGDQKEGRTNHVDLTPALVPFISIAEQIVTAVLRFILFITAIVSILVTMLSAVIAAAIVITSNHLITPCAS